VKLLTSRTSFVNIIGNLNRHPKSLLFRH
jgi:hypothetical protein